MPYREVLGGAVAAGWCWPCFLLGCLGLSMRVGLRMDFSVLLEPLGFVKVLQWVSGAGGAVSSAAPGLVCSCAWAGYPRGGVSRWADRPCSRLLVLGVQHWAAPQPHPWTADT